MAFSLFSFFLSRYQGCIVQRGQVFVSAKFETIADAIGVHPAETGNSPQTNDVALGGGIGGACQRV